MPRYHFISILIVVITIPLTGLATELSTVEEFTKALTPAQTDESIEPKAKIQTRGLGGSRDVDTKPSATMHLTFAINSDNLEAPARQILDNLGRALETEELRNYVYRLEGHTCDRGPAGYNLELSRRRASAVRDYLVRHHQLDDEQFEVVWFGETQPAVPNIDEDARQQNRRVMIVNTLNSLEQVLPVDRPAVMQVKSLLDNQEIVLADGDTLTAKDHYVVEFQTTTDLFVYIFQLDATGSITTLFPNSKFSGVPNPISANTKRRIPSEGRWFYLDENAGQEEVILIAAKTPLEDPESLCRQMSSGWVQVMAGWTTSTALADYAESNVQMRGLGGIEFIEPQTANNRIHMS